MGIDTKICGNFILFLLIFIFIAIAVSISMPLNLHLKALPFVLCLQTVKQEAHAFGIVSCGQYCFLLMHI